MEKIPTLFKRDPDDMRHVLPEVVAGCEWVLAAEGVATRKYDGTCVMFDGTAWWARREVKPGKQSPAGFRAVSFDANTGKTVGWEPIEQSSFAKFHGEALEAVGPQRAGTYELIGEKVNGNPEAQIGHLLVAHGRALLPDTPRDFDGLREWLLGHGYEGIVWHHPDGRMAKLKRRDFS